MDPKHALRRPGILIAALFVAAALAGCSDGGSANVGGPGPQPSVTVAPDKGLGAIVGVVVDSSIVPVEGATVALAGRDATTKTTAEGAFVFDDLEPGPYFVKATKPGYKEIQQSVEVVADVKNPPVVKMLLEADPEGSPFFEEFSFTGFIECSAGVQADGVGHVFWSLCSEEPMSEYNNDKFDDIVELAGTPDLVQSDLLWTSNQQLGTQLSISYSKSSGGVAPEDYASATGENPLTVSAEHALLKDKGIGTETDLWIRIFAWANNGPGAVIGQDFQVITHAFYNFTPPEGWKFHEDGAPVVPS